MRKKHIKTLSTIFSKPALSNIPWMDIETLLIALGANIAEGRDSRVQIELNGEYPVFHRPDPEIETNKGAVASMRKFLINTGVDHEI